MTFDEYFKVLKAIHDEHPELHNVDLIYARDDEGNGYQVVAFEPSVVRYDGEDMYTCDQEPPDDARQVICIN